MTPMRIQRRRVRGWRLPAGAVCVGRPLRFGNPFDQKTFGSVGAVDLFERWLKDKISGAERINLGLDVIPSWEIQARSGILKGLQELRSKNLACWCRLCPAHADGKPLGVKCKDCAPCHADVLLRLANPKATP